jgi:hypothetical protein
MLTSLVERSVKCEPMMKPKTAAVVSAKTARGEAVATGTPMMREAKPPMMPEAASAVMSPTRCMVMTAAKMTVPAMTVLMVTSPMIDPAVVAVMTVPASMSPFVSAEMCPTAAATVVMMVPVVSLVTRPGVTAVTVMPAVAAPMSLEFAPCVPVLKAAFGPVTAGPFASAPFSSPLSITVTMTSFGLFTVHAWRVAVLVRTWPALGMLPSPVFPSLGKFCSMTLTAACPRPVVGLIALGEAVASPWTVIAPIRVVPIATIIVAVPAAKVATVIPPLVRQLVCSHLVRLSPPFHVGRELHQAGGRNPAQEKQHIVSHDNQPFA